MALSLAQPVREDPVWTSDLTQSILSQHPFSTADNKKPKSPLIHVLRLGLNCPLLYLFQASLMRHSASLGHVMVRPSHYFLTLDPQQHILETTQLQHRTPLLSLHIPVFLWRNTYEDFRLFAVKIDIDRPCAVRYLRTKQEPSAPFLYFFAMVAVGLQSFGWLSLMPAGRAGRKIPLLSYPCDVATKIIYFFTQFRRNIVRVRLSWIGFILVRQ